MARRQVVNPNCNLRPRCALDGILATARRSVMNVGRAVSEVYLGGPRILRAVGACLPLTIPPAPEGTTPMSAAPILHTLHPVDLASANDVQKALLDQAVKAVGFIPNMYANMVNAPAVLSTYLHGYALFRSESGLKPAEQEVVFLAVSQVNGCTYCTAAHSMIADKKSGVPADSLAALRDGSDLPDRKLDAVAKFTEAMVVSRGNPGKDAVDAFLAAGYGEKQ